MFVLITYMAKNELSKEKNEPFLAEILEILIIIWYNNYSKNTPIKLIDGLPVGILRPLKGGFFILLQGRCFLSLSLLSLPFSGKWLHRLYLFLHTPRASRNALQTTRFSW